jgi:Tol biopolymer transport system component/DNA-binding winged helix-turn-helix (wHTH) protein
MHERSQALVRFGVFEANLPAGELRKHGLRLRVAGQPFKILAILLERPGEVVTRDELKKSLWPDDTFVDFENSLNSAIKKLRTVLGDSAENPRYIETLPRTGYRFVAPIEAGGREAISGSEQALPPAVPQSKRGWVSAVGFMVVLAGVVALLFTWNLRRPRPQPFEITSTSRVSSDGLSIKAAISPDGRYIARTMSSSGLESLRVRLASTQHEIEIVPPAPVHYLGITFSPNNESLYYVVHSAVSEATVPVLYRVPVMGGPAQKLKEGLNSPVTLSPDGMKYVFMRESDSESTLVLADLESGAEQKLVSRKPPEFLDYPAWSPNGQIIACTTVETSIMTPNGNDGRIVEIRIRDGDTRVLASQHWGLIRQLVWAGDGRGLLMSTREREGIYHVWYVSYPGGVARKVTDGLNQEIGASVASDSRQMVTVQENTLSGIWRMRPRQTQTEMLVSGSGSSSGAVASPDGRVLFEKELNGYTNIWAVDADGKSEKQLTLTGNNYYPSVCRTGRTLVCVSDRTGSSAIWTMDMDGGNPVMVVKAAGDTAPQLSPDGKWIAYTATGSGQWKSLWKVGSGEVRLSS